MKNKNLVVIDLDKERHLYFNLNSLIMVERLTGKKVADLGEDLGLETLRALLFAGLMWEDKKLTVETVGDLIDFNNLSEVVEKLGSAMKDLKS